MPPFCPLFDAKPPAGRRLFCRLSKDPATGSLQPATPASLRSSLPLAPTSSTESAAFADSATSTGATSADWSGKRPACHLRLESYYNSCYNASMTAKLKITTVGNSAGIVLPREILERLRVEKGDVLYATETPNGIELRPYDEEFAEDMAVAERVMRENRDLLRKLAK